MDESNQYRWKSVVLLLGATYLVIGLVFGDLAGSASSNQMRVAWRLAAWVISGVVFGAQIVYEHVRLRIPLNKTALHAALAAGLGSFGLAAAANIHALTSGASHSRGLLLIALVAWPVMTAVPAFVVALGFGAVASLALRRRGV